MNIVRKSAAPIAPTTPAAWDPFRALASPAWDPFRAMRDLMQWDPFAEMAASPYSRVDMATFNPTFEVKETKDGFTFRADLPGIQEKDIEVATQGNRLTISGKREAEARDESDRLYVYERSYGEFTRSFTLPDGTDTEKIVAELKDGVLVLQVPKKAEVQPKKVSVSH